MEENFASVSGLIQLAVLSNGLVSPFIDMAMGRDLSQVCTPRPAHVSLTLSWVPAAGFASVNTKHRRVLVIALCTSSKNSIPLPRLHQLNPPGHSASRPLM